jgi:hypothetical protein
MKHARDDYNRIQDPAGLIPEEEPVFLIRAQDITAPDVLLFWASEQLKLPGCDMNLVELARKQAHAMRQWQNQHGMKIADGPSQSDHSG